MFDSKSFLANVTEKPGIYQMLDDEKTILYVGKAKNLRKRLASYFRQSGLPIKTQAMMKKVSDIQVSITHTENEALILEANLIKKHRPRYNILLRDSKSYPFIHIDTSHTYPRISYYRGNRSQAGKYYGPYPSAHAVKETLSWVQKVLPVRQCDDTFFSNRTRPCLQHQIKRCSAPCVDLISPERYAQDVKLAMLLLGGKDQSMNTKLIDYMDAASKALKFEEAAEWRDRINALKRVQSHQSITSGHSDVDVVAVTQRHGRYCVELAFVRGGRHSGSNGFFPDVGLEEDEANIMGAFLLQHYHNRPAPKEIILSVMPPDSAGLEAYLSEHTGTKVKLVSKVRGDRLGWLKMTQLNASERIKQYLSQSKSVSQRFEDLMALFDFSDAIHRIECFDISHTQGKQTVASCVVFGQEGAIKSDYRRYNISNITPGDDYAAMQQAVTRRYKRALNEDAVLPDILLIDGGKGQLGIANDVLTELGLETIFLIGVAKGEGRKAGLETLFTVNNKQGIRLPNNSPAFHLIQQIRDEAHRFAITGHRARRAKKQTHSILQDIPGVGQKRRQTLLKHFGGLQGLQKAGIKDIATVPGISADLAETIYHYLQK